MNRKGFFVNYHSDISLGKTLFLIYKLVRAPLGISFAFVLMYGVFTGNFSLLLLLSAFGLFLIELFAAIYNDYCDYDEDIRNKRKDKIILAGLLSRKQMRNISFLVAIIALVILWFTNFFVFLLGIYCLVVCTFYSNPKVRLKGSLLGYLTAASAFLFFPLALNMVFQEFISVFTLVFSIFFFFQVMYILCQKDSTDLRDRTNLFLSKGWELASHSAILFGFLASFFLLIIIFFSNITSIIFLFLVALVWLFNAFAKYHNLKRIYKKQITRNLRHVLILFEFLTPYFYVFIIMGGDLWF